MHKIISFSLWGKNKRYSIGAIKNAELAEELFAEWKLKIFFSGVNPEILKKLKKFNNVEMIDCSNKTISPYFWRFFPFFDSEDNITLSRDCDSRLSEREKKCVDIWENNQQSCMIIRDHIRHYDFPILAGMWGYKGKLSGDIYKMMLKYSQYDFYTNDQIFLRDIIFPVVKEDTKYFGIIEDNNFLSERIKILPNFVGQGYDEFDVPIYPVE